MRKLIIVQARMTSTRLPGKVMKIVCGKPLLEHFINRLKRVKYADQIVIATTVNDTDNIIVNLCKKLDTLYYRGSEEDVLGRYYEAAVEYGGDIIIRITSDCPVIDPEVVDSLINFYTNNIEKYDYVSNTLKRTYPQGMDSDRIRHQISLILTPDLLVCLKSNDIYSYLPGKECYKVETVAVSCL